MQHRMNLSHISNFPMNIVHIVVHVYTSTGLSPPLPCGKDTMGQVRWPYQQYMCMSMGLCCPVLSHVGKDMAGGAMSLSCDCTCARVHQREYLTPHVLLYKHRFLQTTSWFCNKYHFDAQSKQLITFFYILLSVINSCEYAATYFMAKL